MNRLEIGAATALVGVGIFQIHDCYIKHAGPLNDVRNAPIGSLATKQKLLDADCLAGGLTLLAGGALAIATGKVSPLILAVFAFSLVAWYYHAACNSHPVTDTYSEDGDTE